MCCDTLTNYSVFNRIDILEILSYLYRLLYRLLDSLRLNVFIILRLSIDFW